MERGERSVEGLGLSRLGVGTVQFGVDYGFTKALAQGQVDEILDGCGELGVRFIDTARSYGDSEKKIGSFLRRHPGGDFTLCSKLRKITVEESDSGGRLRHAIEDSVCASLEALGIDRLPIVMLHQTDGYLLASERFWEAMETVRDKGLFGSFGLSVYEVAELEAACAAGRPAAFFQVPFNVFDRRFAAAAEEARRQGRGVIARSVFLKGLLTAADDKVADYFAQLRPALRRFHVAAERAGLTPAELALLFVLGSGCVDTVVLGVASADELRRNAAALARSRDAAAAIAALAQAVPPERGLVDPRVWPENVFSA
ncbi:MAG: aldo/keto reductase [Elusimicrobiota bacterium]